MAQFLLSGVVGYLHLGRQSDQGGKVRDFPTQRLCWDDVGSQYTRCVVGTLSKKIDLERRGAKEASTRTKNRKLLRPRCGYSSNAHTWPLHMPPDQSPSQRSSTTLYRGVGKEHVQHLTGCDQRPLHHITRPAERFHCGPPSTGTTIREWAYWTFQCPTTKGTSTNSPKKRQQIRSQHFATCLDST
jgi:hypothetical protein